ncbi:hypothetical protein C449_03341 [Halococcus saccharolyticus DSM 5350]|uniref:Uncharacterized protein n=2 Tax=Halococcus saccharolyticus TaxID=62319 RepID=M0MMS1_9EURY|nr:hypothetical protein C449_03341 [Halococcus saccharolyticus DSM 5350]
MQVQPTGGDTTVVLAALVGFVVALVLALAVAYKLFTGYRRVGDPGMFRLAVGLTLLTAVPMLLRVVLTNVPIVSPAARSLAVTGCELGGLVVILVVIYDAG